MEPVPHCCNTGTEQEVCGTICPEYVVARHTSVAETLGTADVGRQHELGAIASPTSGVPSARYGAGANGGSEGVEVSNASDSSLIPSPSRPYVSSRFVLIRISAALPDGQLAEA